jgi:cytochrome c553
MAGFRTGTRPATVMDRIARGLTDAEVRVLAKYLAAPTAPVAPPR